MSLKSDAELAFLLLDRVKNSGEAAGPPAHNAKRHQQPQPPPALPCPTPALPVLHLLFLLFLGRHGEPQTWAGAAGALRHPRLLQHGRSVHPPAPEPLQAAALSAGHAQGPPAEQGLREETEPPAAAGPAPAGLPQRRHQLPRLRPGWEGRQRVNKRINERERASEQEKAAHVVFLPNPLLLLISFPTGPPCGRDILEAAAVFRRKSEFFCAPPPVDSPL